MLLPLVVALRAEAPAVCEPLLRPPVVRVLRKDLGEGEQILAQPHVGGRDRLGLVIDGHLARGVSDTETSPLPSRQVFRRKSRSPLGYLRTGLPISTGTLWASRKSSPLPFDALRLAPESPGC